MKKLIPVDVSKLFKYFLVILFSFNINLTSQPLDNKDSDSTKDLTCLQENPIHYRRNDSTFLENYNPNDKAKYFPLNKVTAGTGIWTELNPNVPRVDYIGVDFVNPDTGWAVGMWGAVIKTTNGGQNWQTLETPTGEILLKVHSFNGQVVMVVGHNGTILRSSDGGDSFTELTGITTQELWGVRMLNDTLGWICGRNNTLLKTTDAGLTWMPIATGFNLHYWQFNFLSEEYFMIACSQGRVLKTTNGGQSFTQHQAGNTEDLFTIDIIDSLHVAAAGSFGKNVYSSDGGITWTENQYTALSINWIQYINKDTGYIAIGTISSFYKTTNRGQSWFNPGFGAAGEWQFELLDESLGYGVGEGLKITKTEDGYTTGRNLILNVDFRDVYFFTETTGFALSWFLYKTTDGGISWQRNENAPGGYDILFLDSLTGFIGGSNLYKTTDGGESWYQVNGVPGRVGKIFFINSLTGWATSGRNILKTTDAGENWFIQFTHINDSFTSIFFIDSLNGWATSRYVHQTTDGGLNWIEMVDIPAFLSEDILFNNYLNGFVIESNKFYSTVDGGVNWILNPFITGFSIAGKFSKYENSVFVTGYKTFRSIDGGLNWLDFDELTGIRINGLSLLGMGFGFAAGELGIVLKYYDETVPVELMNFTALIEDNKVLLNWATASETNNEGFFVERTKEDENYWKTLTFINGAGTSTNTNFYNYIDILNQPGKYKYRLKQVDYNGQYEYSNEIEVKYKSNHNFYLSQNYPNPFNPYTNIDFNIPDKTLVRIILYDATGREITKIIDQEMETGHYSVKLGSEGLSSGIYFYKMVTGSGYTAVNKLTIIK